MMFHITAFLSYQNPWPQEFLEPNSTIPRSVTWKKDSWNYFYNENLCYLGFWVFLQSTRHRATTERTSELLISTKIWIWIII